MIFNFHLLTADIIPLNIAQNFEEYKRLVLKIEDDGIIVLPPLSFTGFNGLSMFGMEFFIEASVNASINFAEFFKDKKNLIILGSPLLINGKTVNAYFFIKSGKILNISLDKTNNPFYKFDIIKNLKSIVINNEEIKIADCVNTEGKNICLYYSKKILKESLIIYPLLEKQLLNSSEKRIYSALNLSYKHNACVAVVGGGFYDSSTSCVISSDKIIANNGNLLKFSGTFDNENIIDFCMDLNEEKCNPKKIEGNSIKDFFVPKNNSECEEILNILTRGLATRLKNTGIKCITLGVSGGSDSVLSLMIAVKAFRELNLPLTNIITMTLSGFGTTSRTFNNAVNLIKELKVKYINLDIVNSVKLHLQEISHNKEDVVFENAQARERTQILMDIANKYNGMMIGTSDMSEIALGFSTFGGDHLSMYNVNAEIAKTTVLALLKYLSKISDNKIIKTCLEDVAATPVSPELRTEPVKSETVIGSYELNDYFLYKFITKKMSPLKIYEDAVITLTDYTKDEILFWLKNFFKKLFKGQFKRNCAPDSVQVFETSLNYKNFEMVSDAGVTAILEELENLH